MLHQDFCKLKLLQTVHMAFIGLSLMGLRMRVKQQALINVEASASISPSLGSTTNANLTVR